MNQYHAVMLDTLVHEINTVRGVLGEPDRLDYVELREGSLTAMLSFGDDGGRDSLDRSARHHSLSHGVRGVRR